MYNKILVPLDGSELAECALPHMESIAKGCGVQNVVLLSVIKAFNMPSGGDVLFANQEDIDSGSETSAEDYLNQVANRATYDGVSIQSEVIVGKAAETITEYAVYNDIDLIIIATHGRSGVSRWVFGSVADRVLRSACVPVLMVRAPGCVAGI